MVPDFTIKGDPGAVRAKAGVARDKGASFRQVGESLAKVTTDGWTGRAADHFRDKFDAEPERWHKAGAGFERAAGALEVYADALADAQARADWAKGEYARGEQVTRDARAAYDADVARARREVADAAARGDTLTLTIIPFSDPGQAVRDGALSELGSARSALEASAQECAAGVRAGCADAPEKRNWLESAAAAVGGVFVGAGEAVWDLGKLVTSPVWKPLSDLQAVLSGNLTPEELAMTYQLTLEQAGALLQALKDDPVGFGQQLGKGVLDWDTWADDPSRALGHLVPDAIAAVFTGGTSAAVTRGLKGADALADLARLARGADGLDGLNDARHAADGLDDLADLGHLDDLADTARLSDDSLSVVPNHAAETSDGTLLDGFGDPIAVPEEGMTVWRVYGEAQDGIGGLQRGSLPTGMSWTPKDPSLSSDFRVDAGLPDENPGRFLIEGRLVDPGAVTEVRPALPLDGNPGGWPEYLIEGAGDAVDTVRIEGVNEPWTRRPGDWLPS